MREIRFRGKRIDNGEWVYGYLIGADVIVGEIVEFNDEYFNTEFWYKVDPETAGQYTGLRDKNGKEIYQGDIIRCPKYYETPENSYNPIEIAGKVVFEEGCWRLSEGGYLYDEHVSYGGEVEVIGNDHDNPELLEKGAEG